MSLWKVTVAEIEEFKKMYNCEVFYTNCINGDNVQKLFNRMAELVADIKIETYHNTIIETQKVSPYGNKINNDGLFSSIVKYC